jgi:hypothetical protein
LTKKGKTHTWGSRTVKDKILRGTDNKTPDIAFINVNSPVEDGFLILWFLQDLFLVNALPILT